MAQLAAQVFANCEWVIFRRMDGWMDKKRFVVVIRRKFLSVELNLSYY